MKPIWTMYDAYADNRVVAKTEYINNIGYLVLQDRTKPYPETLFFLGDKFRDKVRLTEIMKEWFPLRGFDRHNNNAEEILKGMGLKEYILNTIVYMTNAKTISDPFWIDFGDGELDVDFIPDPHKRYNVPYRMEAIK